MSDEKIEIKTETEKPKKSKQNIACYIGFFIS